MQTARQIIVRSGRVRARAPLESGSSGTATPRRMGRLSMHDVPAWPVARSRETPDLSEL